MAPGGAWSGTKLDACAETVGPRPVLANASKDRRDVRGVFHCHKAREFIESLRSFEGVRRCGGHKALE
jgi:hypothetical protein